jgi:RNA-directed DNA polymerase
MDAIATTKVFDSGAGCKRRQMAASQAVRAREPLARVDAGEQHVRVLISELRLPQNLTSIPQTTRHSSKRGTRRVTGIIRGSDGQPHIGRAFKRKIRSLIYKINSLDRPARASLAGVLAYAAGFDKDFMNSLITKYGPSLIVRARKQDA